jgi:hypothetical protein
MQQVLDSVTSWGHEQGLKFGASKWVAITFTQKRKYEVPPLLLNGVALPWQTQVKYLGVTLDWRLNWIAHILRLLFKYKQIVGKEFGPYPKYMRGMYSIVRLPYLCIATRGGGGYPKTEFNTYNPCAGCTQA